MTTTYVAIDVETTGLDSARDAIIEVAAVTFRGNEVTDEFTSLVNPLRDIPPFVSQLTGITDAMVADAPGLFSLRSRLKSKLADHVIVGHNVEFDLGFLREATLAHGNRRVDTMTLASILVPEAGRFGLSALAAYLNFPVADGNSHRALTDAVQTVELFLALRERALALSLAQLEEIVSAGQRLGWPETTFFEDVLAERARHAFEGGEMRARGQLPRLYHAPKLEGQALVPAEHPAPLDTPWITSLIRPGGHFGRAFPGFEHRPQQVEMLRAVAEAFNEGRHVLVEAGTGTGKSLGYLLPAAFWATENGRRVVISTNTINLQDQLVNKDVPALRDTLNLDLRVAVRKGRSNYLCTRLFQQMRRAGPGSADEMTLYARVLLWLPNSQTGDLGEIVLRTPGERLAWSKLSGENPTCTSDQCAAENCPLHIARRRAELAHLVVVNHSLLLADLSSNGMVLPEYTDLIIDEAHHLEAAVTDGLSFRADRRFLETILEEASRPRAGLVGNAQQRVAAVAPRENAAAIDALAERLRADANAAIFQTQDFFTTFDFFLRGQERERTQFAAQLRLTAAVRIQPDYHLIEEGWTPLNRLYAVIARDFLKLSQAIADLGHVIDIEGEDELRAALTSSGQTLEEARANIDALVAQPNAEMIYWAEQYKDNISLHAAPLHVGPLVDKHIFQSKETVVLTSATLRTAGFGGTESTFNYLRERLHAHEADELAVGSPFDYKNSTLLYLVTDIPEPNQPGYQRLLEQAIIDTAVTLGGRTLVLFTANNHLNQTAAAIDSQLTRHNITTLAQGSGASRQQLLEQFRREGGRNVLLGTRSFWEGVDVPGPALTALLIAKLPFDVPTDPVFAARSETYENPFFEYSIPEAVLRFRQGFGRLIRRGSDEGIVICLDKRLLTKRYGGLFLEALPACTVVRQRADRIEELVGRWMARDRSRKL
jgi:DNA polymerase-3 subunit epsilon/ATP-dependent DNA helicase DinG